MAQNHRRPDRDRPTGPPGARTERTSGNEDRQWGAAVLALIAAWGLVAGYVVHSQLPSNALELPGQPALRPSVQAFAPQGWAFFTRSPREPRVVAWRPTETGGWERAMLAPHAEPRNVFGLNRQSRAQPVEMSLLIGRSPAQEWQDCGSGDVPACLAGIDPGSVPVVDNPSPGPLMCGEFGFSSQEPLPWAWADSAGTTSMPATVLRLSVRC